MRKLQYAGQVYGVEELQAVVRSVSGLRIAAGEEVSRFERGVADWLSPGCWFRGLAVNSGSSANLLAISSLFSTKLSKEPRFENVRDSNRTPVKQPGRRAVVGDEVITVACGFPSTIAPIVQTGLVPVFLDVTIPEYNVDVSKLEEALSSRTVAVFLAHTLGNPFNVKVVTEFCRKHSLWLIEDNCDAFGSRYFLDGNLGYTGTFGDMSTLSFYPAHHITTGEGGMVLTNNDLLYRILMSLRDWGRDCWCAPGENNCCGYRFGHRHGTLPDGYDHKYIYSHLGYNLKMVEPCGALGNVQLERLKGFIEKRKHNWNLLRGGLEDCDAYILPRCDSASDPSWFSFMLCMSEDNDIRRVNVVKSLLNDGIDSRPLFAGNILRHPCFSSYEHKFRVVGDGYTLKNSDYIVRNGFMVGVYPGLSDDGIFYMIGSLRKAVGK